MCIAHWIEIKGNEVVQIFLKALIIKRSLKSLQFTVYNFEFAQFNFCPIEIWDWFAQSWIRPLYNFLI